MQEILEELAATDKSVLVSIVILVLSSFVYVRSMVKGKSKPSRVTRLVVFLTMIVSVLSLEYDGSKVGLWIAYVVMARVGLIWLLSLKYGSKETSKIDYPCLFVALIALVILFLTENPTLGIALFVVVDTVGYIPAYVKTWKDPQSEGAGFYFWEIVALLPVIFSSSSTTNDLVFAGYIISCISLMLVLIYRLKLTVLFTRNKKKHRSTLPSYCYKTLES